MNARTPFLLPALSSSRGRANSPAVAVAAPTPQSPPDLYSHGTDPVMIAREIARAEGQDHDDLMRQRIEQSLDRTATKQDRERRKAEARMTIVVDDLWIDMHAREDWRRFWRVALPAVIGSAATFVVLTYAYPPILAALVP